MTGTLNGDGSALTGIAATNWIANNVTANSGTTTINLSLGNVVKFTQTSNTTVSFANTGTSNIVSFIRPAADYTITWPSAIKWDGGSAPTLDTSGVKDANVITLLTRDEGVTWYGWESVDKDVSGTELFIVGRNNYGQLAQNDVTFRSSPVQITGKWSTALGGTYTYIGTKTDGTLWVWGSDFQGALGQNSPTYNPANWGGSSSPVQILGTWKNSNSRTLGAAVCTGAIKTDGTLWLWGQNGYGRLGDNSEVNKSSPTQVPGTTWAKYSSGSAGCSGAVKTDGTAWVWGNNAYGNLGQNQNGNPANRSSPVQLPGTTWDYIEHSGTGGWGSFGLKTDGTLWSWGYNDAGALGLNSQGPGGTRSSPTQIPGTTWRSISGSYINGVATKTDNTLWAWGTNLHGQLGQNNLTQRSSPVQVPGTDWADAVTGRYIITAIKTDGTLWSWGYNSNGQLAQNSTTRYSSPVQIPGTWSTLLQPGAWNNIALK